MTDMTIPIPLEQHSEHLSSFRRYQRFDYKHSDTYKILKEHFGEKRSKAELLSVARLLCQQIETLRLDRKAKRGKNQPYN